MGLASNAVFLVGDSLSFRYSDSPSLAIKRSVGHVGGTTGLAPPSDILAAMLFFIGA